MSKNIYGDDINYDELEQHTYEDSGNDIFYTCPICRGEYLADFMTESGGRTMCIECWNERYGDWLMSNLGVYQWMTSTAKKVGGPVKFLLLVGATGAGLYKVGEVAVKKCVKTIRKDSAEDKDSCFSITAKGESIEGLKFEIGDKFKVLEVDKDALLIEKLGDSNNPYFVSKVYMKEISDYEGGKEDGN